MGLVPQNCRVPAADVSSRAAFGISERAENDEFWFLYAHKMLC